MSKSKDLEELFLEKLKHENLNYNGRIFDLGVMVMCADYIFGDSVIVVMDRHIEHKIKTIEAFKKKHCRYQLILLTDRAEEFANEKCFSEIYDRAGLGILIKKLKKITEDTRLS